MAGHVENGKLTGVREPAFAGDAFDSLLTIWLRCVEASYLARDDLDRRIRLFRKVYDVDELRAGRRIEIPHPRGRQAIPR